MRHGVRACQEAAVGVETARRSGAPAVQGTIVALVSTARFAIHGALLVYGDKEVLYWAWATVCAADTKPHRPSAP